VSRVGNLPVSLPKGVDISVSKSNVVTVKGPKGSLHENIDPDITIKMEDGQMTFSRPTDQNRHKALHGLSRALINNMIVGVTEGFTKSLELVGVGYRVTNTGNLLEIIIGYSHPIYFFVPNEIKVETKTEKGSNPTIILTSNDKQLLGQVAAKIRAYRSPEPYKGKGIKYTNEIIRRKAGKTSGKK
jgi:large subunit ribosomal protein L6